MNIRTMIFLAAAIAFALASRAMDLRGDLAPFGVNGISPERAKNHMIALVLLLTALWLFYRAARSALRHRRDRTGRGVSRRWR